MICSITLSTLSSSIVTLSWSQVIFLFKNHRCSFRYSSPCLWADGRTDGRTDTFHYMWLLNVECWLQDCLRDCSVSWSRRQRTNVMKWSWWWQISSHGSSVFIRSRHCTSLTITCLFMLSARPSPRPRGSARRKTASSLILRGHF